MATELRGLAGCRFPRNASAQQVCTSYNLFTLDEQKMYTRINEKSQIISATVVKDDKRYHIAHRFASRREAKLLISGVEEAAAANPDNTVLKDNKSLLYSIDESLNHIL
ncbi:hypothetical protein CMK12_06005 [Candidatus Poribacteria bacterium]|jgi:hypothetical protein|nr:hypothetical protein [Candidatus Poribacteria bacterium]MDP6750727.1 hypothetical protein [Candidatus Poribacteria bacterium]MDP6999559.1 hypothetical protein [Candidatus Poribacteria bacterium]